MVWLPGANTPVDHSATPPAFKGCADVVVTVPSLSVKATVPVAGVAWLAMVALPLTGCASSRICAP